MKYTHLLLIFAFACRNADVKDEEADVAVDADGDGFSSAEDCNDTDPTAYPDAEEICDGVDNNCDGDIDESVLLSFYVDADGDGFGSENTVLEACEVIEGFVENSDDCDDTRAEIHPDADEICDGLDNNCNGDTDEGLLQTYYVDADNDGFGNPELEVESCEAEQGLSLLDGDCDDQNDDIHPDGIEMCDEVDNNCDGTIDEGVTATFYVDFDGDGHGDENQSIEACSAPEGHVTVAGDCNDIEYYVNPQMIEYCDTVDNDCDGDIDESGAIGETTFYADQDEDGFGDPEDTVQSCSQPPQYTTDNTDCDDNDNDVHPGADEYCNGDDADCDGLTYENDSVDATTYYADQDEDGFGDANNTTLSCALPPQYTTDSTDCDDNDNDAYPGAAEYCNGEDDDCDGDTDEDDAADAIIYYADIDNDGYGDPDSSMNACTQPAQHTTDNTDCNDGNNAVYPGADEYCNGSDDDCDGNTDESDSVDAITYYADLDNDGFGDTDSSINACTQPAQHTTDSADCDDSNNTIYTGADEYCNGSDDDCDGDIDEDDAADAITYYADLDNDGYGDPDSSMNACTQPAQHTTDSADCNDSNNAVYPGADEYCNGGDDDCDGNTDESDAADAITYYADIDNDGYGDTDSSVNACTQPAQHTIDSADCDDGNNAVYPGADEYCNGEDDDCDGNTDEDDAVDATLWYYDGDVDGYGIESNSVRACTAPTDYVDNAQDCNDANGYGPNCTSCKEIYDQGLGSTDDYYLVQPSAQLPNQEVWCDMSSGGWTLVYLATNSGGLTENGSVTSGSAIGSTPFAPGDTGHYKLSDDVINSLRSGAVNNDLKVVVEYNGSILGTTWHPSSCTLASGTFHAASHVCNKSVNDGMDSTNYTQSGHPGSLSRWYVDSDFGYIWPNTHIGPIPGGTGHGSSLPTTYCTWYDSRHCPTSGVFQIWAY